MLKDLDLSIQIIVICRTFQKKMISQKSPQHNFSLFATPPPKKHVEPRSITRKPSLVSFTKKKPTEIAEIRSSDRIRFISPTKANLFITQDMLDPQTSIEFNYTQYPSNQQINYPFIRKCASPKHYDYGIISRKSSFCPDNIKQDSVFLSTFLQPSIQDFSSCQFDTSIIKNSSEQLQQEISNLKKTNFQLNLLLDEKNQLLEKQKLDYDARLAELTQQLMEIKCGIQNSQGKIVETQKKMFSYQSKVKKLEQKLSETADKLDKAEKQVKMYKAKYRINFNNPKLTEDLKSKKYHQNCCKGHVNHTHTKNHHRNSQSNSTANNQKNNTLKQSKKINTQSQGPLLKKIKSQTILPLCDHPSLEASPQASRLMKIHSNEEDFNQYISMKIHIENLAKQIRYKDIEILTLKKTKCEFEKEKENFQKVKKFNQKLLARVEFLTKECEQADKSQNKKRLSLPLQMTPKKKFQVQYEEFDNQSDQDGVSEIVEFELSPQKNFQKANMDTTDTVFEIDELK